MVIGKGGNYIKQIKEESGAYIQISQKSKETNLPERCITVAGMLSGGIFCNSYFKNTVIFTNPDSCDQGFL